jgi:hypothetical protein
MNVGVAQSSAAETTKTVIGNVAVYKETGAPLGLPMVYT